MKNNIYFLKSLELGVGYTDHFSNFLSKYISPIIRFVA